MPIKFSKKIALLDSGVGGISILNAIKKQLPDIDYCYFMDNQRFPYGTKSDQEISQAVLAACKQLIELEHPNLIIIACNTASTIVLNTLREQVSIPIVGVVPAIKPAASQSKSKVIGVLTTLATSTRDYLKDLIKTYAPGVTVHIVPSQDLVQLAENKLADRHHPGRQWAKDLDSLLQKAPRQIDTIVLGCTHFPLVLEELRAVPEWPVNWICSSNAVANRTASLLESVDKRSDGSSKRLYVSRKSSETDQLFDLLRQTGHFEEMLKLII